MISWKRLVFLVLAAVLIKRSGPVKQLLMSYRARTLKINKIVFASNKYDGVLKAFRQNFLEGREKGAQLALSVNGEIVCEANGGRDESVVFDDLAIVFSCSKVIESLCVAMLVDRGKLEYDAPIAKYWPEFGRHISPTTTVSELMRHGAGLEQVHKPLTTAEALVIFNDIKRLEQWLCDTMVVDEDVKRGERKTRYHAITRGFFVDVLIARVDGRRGRDFIREEIVAKVPGAEFYLGCPPEAQSRMAHFEAASTLLDTALEIVMHKLGIVKTFYHPGPNASEEVLDAHERDFYQEGEVEMTLQIVKKGIAYKSLILLTDTGLGAHHWANAAQFRSLPLMSGTGITNARSLALIGAELAKDGGCLLSPQGFKKALESPGRVFDEMLNHEVTYTNCGWSTDRLGKDWVGWAGAGGSVFIFSHKYRASFSYVPTRLEGRTHKPNGIRILKEFNRTLQ